ncbi:TetR/AcrR family transcriptional regulator [Glutamicibacter halophytocola]|uniref:TetR family transcriptional regulator n=1 Tax=Glutamicibacter halophytocola TaxID=1933880 RepID=A0A5B8IJJ7_9MICC|nr:TetR family transcriptional regulator [Glutamicibacter halophytocola]QDY65824.1 TetR family transcriptional regulator [Glutamicibacter halophytocola]UUX57919.1 TetR family transcriptional regulator [Glutamicibacter halophytocola]
MSAQHSSTGSRLGRRNDPERRQKIMDACLEVIAHSGVTGTSHRKVAAQAGVPLGAMTYYFDGMHDVLHSAFSRFATSISNGFERQMAEAADRESACQAVFERILQASSGQGDELILSHELYTLATRDASFRSITTWWMGRSQLALGAHFDPQTARLLDAMIEGLTIHRALDSEARDPEEVRSAIARITRL